MPRPAPPDPAKPLLSLEQKQFILDADDHEDYMARLLKAVRELGVDVLTAKEILGHASVETTMRYLHKSEANVKLATVRLGAWVQEARHFDDTPCFSETPECSRVQ